MKRLLLLTLLVLTFGAKAQTSVVGEHSPDVALRWSLIPGAGQIYNHQAWKAPII